MHELLEAVWSNPKLHSTAKELQRVWLARELGSESAFMEPDRLARCMQAAAILSTSSDGSHRQAAYRIATQAFDLGFSEARELGAALRVVLGRLGNFPSFATAVAVENGLPNLPWRLAAEELYSSAAQTVVSNGAHLVLSSFQHSLWRTLESGVGAAVSAPTSAGKSFVLLNYLASRCASPGEIQIVYLVPTRALITQVSSDLEKGLAGALNEPVDIITVPLDRETALSPRSIYVLTPERLQVLLHSHGDFEATLAVVDEAHLIAEGSRGILLQWVVEDLLARNPKTQLLFASPLIRNLDVFGRALGLEGIVETGTSEPSVAQNLIVVEVDSAPKGKITLISASEGAFEEIQKTTLETTLANKFDKLVHIPARFGAGQQNIVYANGSADAEKIAMLLADKFSDREATKEQRELSELAKEVVHGSYVLSATVLKGIGFHYSNIPAVLRKAIEDAFSTGVLDYIVSTSTLLQGVNTPAKNIFMCYPEKGHLKPMESTDFWNLAGRAGRLQREFHGNIFLIDYSKWKRHPLLGPRDDVIIPAIEGVAKYKQEELVRVIQDSAVTGAEPKDLSTQAAFTRLYVDLKNGNVEATLAHAGLEQGSPAADEIVGALRTAEGTITLPDAVLRQSPNISVHRQEKLYAALKQSISLGEEQARALIPSHPREASAFESYARILELCHSLVLRIDTARNLHSFHALLAQRWMNGWPLPRIIEAQIRRKPNTDTRKVIRDTLETVESQIRFSVVRLFTCYNAILNHALAEAGYSSLLEDVSDVPVFLEVGASDRTMISFMALGLSRPTAMRLNELAADKDLDPAGARAWLVTRDLEAFGLSPLLAAEVRRLLASNIANGS